MRRPDPHRHRRHRLPARPRRAVPGPAPSSARRPGAARTADGRQVQRRAPRGVLLRGGRARSRSWHPRHPTPSRRCGPRSTPTPPSWPCCRASPASTPPPAPTAATGLAEQLGCEPGQLVLPPDSSPRYAGFSADGATYLSVVPAVEPVSPERRGPRPRHPRRATPPATCWSPASRPAWSTPTSRCSAACPWRSASSPSITSVLLFMMFGSVVIPLKAIVLNLLSLTATFGAMVWIFQEGHLSGLLDFTATGSLDAAMPILMFCVAFGLSMDYEVFLLSRIKEEHDNGADNVALGGRGPRADGPHRHRRRRPHRGRVHRLRHQPGQLHQAVRHRPDPGGADRRLPHPRHAGPGVHAAGRRLELVGARCRCAASTTAGASASTSTSTTRPRRRRHGATPARRARCLGEVDARHALSPAR